MCISAPVDAVVGTAVVLIGADALRRVRDRRDVGLASLPVLLGVHQLIEVAVWLGLDGTLSQPVAENAMAAYLLVAFLLPVLVPAVVAAREDDLQRRRIAWGFAALGAAVAFVLVNSLIRGPVAARESANAIVYEVGIPFVLLVSFLYVTATCGALLASSDRQVMRFGVYNLAAVPVIGLLSINGFVSLWCAWAAAASVVIAIHLRAEAVPPDQATQAATS